ncbi:MAG: acetolactate synthase small subunit [Solobacterium sp.]|nr:acetolactate synthase small subunit [Solobacterium sp.]MBR2793314.1 acetolactate synthase small subunit [Solobacterium sp.]
MADNIYPRSVISILVENHYGVLARIASMFNRRSFNIDSIAASETIDPGITRITITVHCDQNTLRQMLLQTERLEEVKKVFLLSTDSLQRELLLIKIECNPVILPALRDIAGVYKAKIIDLSPESLVMELTGKPEKIDGFLKMFGNYNVLEMCRTGITALDR